jgi:hypothetical protein
MPAEYAPTPMAWNMYPERETGLSTRSTRLMSFCYLRPIVLGVPAAARWRRRSRDVPSDYGEWLKSTPVRSCSHGFPIGPRLNQPEHRRRPSIASTPHNPKSPTSRFRPTGSVNQRHRPKPPRG